MRDMRRLSCPEDGERPMEDLKEKGSEIWFMF